MHKAGYLHRDIKPGNIFMRERRQPGAARLRLGAPARRTELTAVVSPGYAPFEQYHTQGKQGPWSDLYALGGVLYWMVTGKKPVEAAARVREDTDAGRAAGRRPAPLPRPSSSPRSTGRSRRSRTSGRSRWPSGAMPCSRRKSPLRPKRRNDSTQRCSADRSAPPAGGGAGARRAAPGRVPRAGGAVVVKRAAMKARDEAELYLLLADEIEDKEEKKAFIRKAVSISGKPES